MGITENHVSFDEAKVGDWLALKHDPPEPMKVLMKYGKDDLITLSIDYKGSAVKKLTRDEFDKAGYFRFEKE